MGSLDQPSNVNNRITWENLSEEQLQIEKVKGALGIVWDKDVEGLREAVERSHNTILALIHPYSEQYDPAYRTSNRYKDAVDRLERRLDAYISSESRTKPPVIVFEEEQFTGRTRSAVDNTAPQGTAYVVQTRDNMSEPLFVFRGKHGATNGSWEELKEAFKYLGIKKILIGGMYLESMSGYAAKRPGNSWGQYKKCVSGALINLGRDFEVEVSSFTFPLARKDVHPKPSKRKRSLE